MLQERCQTVNQLEDPEARALTELTRKSIGFAKDSIWTFERIKAPTNSTLAYVTLSIQILLSLLERYFFNFEGELIYDIKKALGNGNISRLLLLINS